MKISRVTAVTVIIAVGVICYMNSIGGDFIWDDLNFVLGNPAIRTLKNAPSFFSDPQTLAAGALAFENYRPLVTLSFAADYALWGINTFGYHLTNTMLHLVNAALVFAIAEILCGSLFAALAAALIFVSHPLQTEAVTWISGRSNVLFMFFFSLAFLLYIKWGGDRRRPWRYSLSLVLFTASLLSKETAVTFPFILIAYEALLKRKKMVAQGILPVAPFLVITAVFICARTAILGKVGQMAPWGGSVLNALYITPQVIAEYAKLALLPAGLCVDRQFMPDMSAASVRFLASAGFLILSLSAFIFAARKRPVIAFSIAWFFIALAPVSNVIPIKALVAERFMYMPLAGAAVLIGIMLEEGIGRRALRIFLLAAMTAVLSSATAARNDDWKSALSLYESALREYPGNARLRVNAGLIYQDSKMGAKAEAEFTRAIRLDPAFIKGHMALSQFYFAEGRLPEAESAALNGLEKADYPGLTNLIAVICAERREFDKAAELLRGCVAAHPGYFKSYLNLSAVLLSGGKPDEAMAVIEAGIAASGNDMERAQGLLRLAEIYEKSGAPGKAADTYAAVIRRYPHERTACQIAREKMDLSR